MLPNKTAARSPTKSSDEAKMRVHTGLVDQTALSSKPPKEVMYEVLRVLQEMGMEIKKENEFRLRCTRARKRKSGATTGLGLGSVMSVGSTMGTLMNTASVSRVRSLARESEMSLHIQTDSRGLPLPSTSSGGLLSGGGIKGMLMRRGSSYSSTHPNLVRSDSDNLLGSPSASSAGFGSPAMMSSPNLHEPLYGEHS
jgi:protein-serine/threonine kinase